MLDSFVFTINAVLPIIIMVAIGYIFKKTGFISQSFSKTANKLVFHIFLPAMLFMNVYKIDDIAVIDIRYILFVAIMVVVVFVLALISVLFVTDDNYCRGPLLQGVFRSNYALVGIPLAKSLFGDEGAMVATLLSVIVIPLLNILAVISLSIFNKCGEKPSIRRILLGIIKNPLIQSIAIGIVCLVIRYLFTYFGISFRISHTPVYDVLGYLSNLATPLALLVLGAQFEFSAVKDLKKEILFGTLTRTVFVPVFCLGIAYLCFSSIFSGAHFAAFVAVFATPVSVSSVPMTQEMGGNTTLAGQLVVWTTAVSAFSVFLYTFILRILQIF